MTEDKKWIKNFDNLATSSNRKIALEIAEAGLDAVNTAKVVSGLIMLERNILSVKGQKFDLDNFKKIKVLGFGKASCEAAVTLEKILKSKIDEGAVIGLNKVTCEYIETFAGTHPRPSEGNVMAGKKIFEIAQNSTEEDLVIVIVSGGGSALLCWPESECDQGTILYDKFLSSGKDITMLNTVRKHISSLKGGGLAKILYPATVVGLIFSDIPGDRFQDVASGPIYKDETTVEDAQKIITEHGLGTFDLVETPKEDVYFEKVHNIVLVSNKTALEAMAKKTEELGYKPKIISSELYENAEDALQRIFSNKEEDMVVLAAGEPKLKVEKSGGSGGRNLFMGLRAIELVPDNSVFISLASDGMDNSDAAGAVVDSSSGERIEKAGIKLNDYISNFDAYPVFEKLGDMIMTGPTGANVSDLFIFLTKKNG